MSYSPGDSNILYDQETTSLSLREVFYLHEETLCLSNQKHRLDFFLSPSSNLRKLFSLPELQTFISKLSFNTFLTEFAEELNAIKYGKPLAQLDTQ